MTNIAIVGAGLAGLAAARMLKQAGRDCIIFDKSRGIGGRMATRRVGQLAFDHGVQFFTARGASFKACVEAWLHNGHAASWYEDNFVGTPGMTAPARALAAGLAVEANRTVTGLRRDRPGWRLLFGDEQSSHFQTVLFAVPAPQLVPILATAGIIFPQVEPVRFAPCWALMLAYDTSLEMAEHHYRSREGVIAWAALNGHKPGRETIPETLMIHANPEWSRTHLESEPPAVTELLLAAARQELGIEAKPVYFAAHRWRFALVETPAGVDCIHDATLQIGACGDWCLGARVEAAFDSGEALARRVIANS